MLNQYAYVSQFDSLFSVATVTMNPIPMLIWCPMCNQRHIDQGDFAVRPHHTHACQFCGFTWRPAIVATVGVRFLPGFKDDDPPPAARAPEPSEEDTLAEADARLRRKRAEAGLDPATGAKPVPAEGGAV